VTLRVRLSVVFAFVVLAPLVVAAILVGTIVPRTLDNEVMTRLVATRAAAVDAITAACTQARLAAEVLGREATGAGSPAAAVVDVVRRGLGAYAVVADPRGRTEAHAGSLPGTASAPSVAGLGSCGAGRPQPEPGVVSDAVAVRDPAGRILGQAAVGLPIAATLTRLAAGSHVDVTLVAGGRSVASTLPAAAARSIAAVAARAVTDPHPLNIPSGIALGAPANGAVVVVSTSDPSLAGLEAVLWIVVVAGVALAGVIGWQLARLTVRPLAELSDAAARIAGGDLDTRIVVSSRDEVGRLARAFNAMTDDLRGYIGQIESSHGALRQTLDRLGETLSGTLDLDHILSAVLDGAMTMTGAASAAIYLPRTSGEAWLAHRRGLPGRDVPPMLPIPVVDRGGEGEIVVELRSSGAVRGILLLFASPGTGFDQRADFAVRGFAAQAAVAIDNVRLHEEARRLSATDELTGLANFRAFQSTLRHEVDRASRFDRPVALLMLDLDNFKAVNDTFGHLPGDAVLAEVARRISGCVREVDSVARYGGEEFAVILPETEAEGAAVTAARICAAVRDRPIAEEVAVPISVTISIGVAAVPSDAATAEALIGAADRALYEAKHAGRDQWWLATGHSGAAPP